MAAAPTKEACALLVEQVRAGEVDPSSTHAQQLLMVGLVRGWITRPEADAAADTYWDNRVHTVLTDVAAGKLDPSVPETDWLLEWGVNTKRITGKQRRDAIRAFAQSVD